MKKVFFAVLLMVSSSCAIAQLSFQPRNPRLFYRWWYEDYLSQDSTTLTCSIWLPHDTVAHGYRYIERERAVYHYTDSPITLVGIAGALASGSHYYKKGGDTITPETFFNLYETHGDSLLLLRHVPIVFDDGDGELTFLPVHNIDTIHFDMAYFPQTSIDTCFIYQSHTKLPIYEYYFEEPITVSDSFYISFGEWTDNVVLFALRQCSMSNRQPEESYNCLRAVQQPEFPKFKYKCSFFRINSLGNVDTLNHWDTSEEPMFPLIFPILQQAECKTVKGLHLAWQRGNTVRIEWDNTDESNLEWEFTYTPENQSRYSGPIIHCSEPWVEISLEHGGNYFAYVRQKCNSDEYSSWSMRLPFSYDGNAITNPPEEAPIVIPNPTTGVVTINSPYGLLHIEVYDMAGVRLLDLPCHDEEVKIDLSRFPAGSYLLKTASLNGTATQTIVKD